MPGYRRGFSRRRNALSLRPVNSIKNQVVAAAGVTDVNLSTLVAKAVTSPSPTVSSDVSHGCNIKAIWVSFDICGLAGSGVLNNFGAYLIKNPGNNLTPPGVFSVGTSNEKKFVFKQWHAMIMRNQDGNNPYHWEGWVPIPKRYQRMGTDDTFRFIISVTATLTAHMGAEFIYKWYR